MNKEKTIRLYAMQNAVKFNGNANPKAVMGQILQAEPELRKEAKTLLADIQIIVDEISKLSVEEQKAELQSSAPELLEKKVKEKHDLFDRLKIPKGTKVSTAFPPEPSKYPHIGHAKAIIVNYELAKRKNGKFTLRFEDTNPTLAKKEFYDIHLENYKWLGIKPDVIDYASNHMETFYEKAELLIKNDDAYICDCPQEEMRAKRMKGEACKCRSLSSEQNMQRWETMKTAPEGKMVLRAKIDIAHKNSTMRDPALMRVIDHKHVRTGTKYRLWPAYDLENSIMDGVEKITHRLRSKEFEMRNELQRYLQNKLGYAQTNIYEFARFNLKGVESSGRIIRDKIAQGVFSGWDDPNLTTLVALRRRGFTAEAIKSFVLSTGITKSEATLTWDDLIMHNKRLLDASANRYFFVANPMKITIEGAPNKEVSLKKHPEHPDRGTRDFKTSQEFFIAKADFNFEEGKLYRLMDCLNFEKKADKFIFISDTVDDYRARGGKIIHWLPAEKNTEVTVRLNDNSIVKGLAEPSISELKTGDIIQFERFGFCRLDAKNQFWFTHR